MIGFFRECGPLVAVGIGSFGPVDLRQGRITTTPKPGWAGTDVAGPIAAALGVPVAFDTDVGAAAVGEHRWGAGRGRHTLCYLTVGTGIGGAAIVNGELLHGAVHSEMGHQRIPHNLAADPFPGSCPYHGDCWEGLASGTSMAARWGRPAAKLAADHEAWALEARYLAAGLANVALVLSTPLVVIGGGVIKHPHLLDAVHEMLTELLAGYVPTPELVPAGLGDRSGVLGALVLAEAVVTPE